MNGKLGNKQFYWGMAILGIVASVWLLLYRIKEQQVPASDDFTYLKAPIAEAATLDKDSVVAPTPSGGSENSDAVNVKLFPFDPNTASVEELVLLGLKPKVAQTIHNYRSKGGTFYKPEDFKRIYTLSPYDYERLRPYIRIAGAPRHKEQRYTSDQAGYQPKTNHPIEINGASIEVWQQQKGIGSGFAHKIVDYKERLGGFLYKEQLKEIYGLPDSTYQNLLPHMTVNTQLVQPISINTCTESMLANHPYIGTKMAAHIIKLRNDMGKFNKMEDLKMVPLINEEKYRKIAQYLKVN